MRAVDVITTKREGGKLTREQIGSFIQGYISGEVADYQASALLMAIFLRGADFEETAALTEVMIKSGEVFDLTDLGLGTTVDKHSTGGVGDKVSLILAPLAAACGVAVPMVSGRGLGHTGGTLDKLESIPGFNVRLSREQFRKQLCQMRVSMIGQTDSFVPADKKLYALRDVTATVESIPLICASIMSKKVASGAQALVMDVKTGTGAFMKTQDQARELAKNLIGVGRVLNRPVRALITDMNQPLGRWIGNSLEVREAIDCLHGGGPADLRLITLELTAEMILLANPETKITHAEAMERAVSKLDSGAAYEVFRQMVITQGGDVSCVEDPAKLEIAPGREMVKAARAGYISATDCRQIGIAAVVLGAGRERTTDAIDPGVGLEMLVRIGDRVEAGQPVVHVVHREGRGLQDCLNRLERAITISEEPAVSPELIKERVV